MSKTKIIITSYDGTWRAYDQKSDCVVALLTQDGYAIRNYVNKEREYIMVRKKEDQLRLAAIAREQVINHLTHHYMYAVPGKFYTRPDGTQGQEYEHRVMPSDHVATASVEIRFPYMSSKTLSEVTKVIKVA